MPSLTPLHVAWLTERGIAAQTAERAGLFSASDETVKALLGYGGCGQGLVFPYEGTNQGRVRIDAAGPDGKRYRQAKGSGNRLYLRGLSADQDVLQDPSVPLYVSEGEFKALKACQEGFPTVAVSGVWSWKTRLHGKSLEIADLDRVEWRKRRVIVVFDSDAGDKPPVAWAEHALCQTLRQRGAEVYVIRLPDGPKGEKYGLDDFLVACGPGAFTALEMQSVVEGDGGLPTFLRVADLAEAYLLAACSPTARLGTGYPDLDGVLRGVAPGEVLTILGRSGVGKTAFLLSLAQGMTHAGQVPALIFSLEQPGPQLFERMVQLETGLSGRDIEARARLEDVALHDQIMATCRAWEHVVTVDRPCSLAQLDALVGESSKAGLWAEPLRLVFVDYLGMLTTEPGKSYEVVSHAAKALKQLAKRHRVALVLLCQVGREGESGGKPVSLTMARDSGVVEESADYMLGIWRPELDDELKAKRPADWAALQGVLLCRVLKNRSGPAGTLVRLAFQTPSLRITPERKVD